MFKRLHRSSSVAVCQEQVPHACQGRQQYAPDREVPILAVLQVLLLCDGYLVHANGLLDHGWQLHGQCEVHRALAI